MNYFVLTFQYWEQVERRIIKTTEESAFKIHSELVSKITENANKYHSLKRDQYLAEKEDNDTLVWELHDELCKLPDSIGVLDFEVKFDDFISESWDGYNHFKIQTLAEWAEEQYLSEQNQ